MLGLQLHSSPPPWLPVLGALALAACGPVDPGSSPLPDEGSPFSGLQFTVDFGYTGDMEFVSVEEEGSIPAFSNPWESACNDSWFDLAFRISALEQDGSLAILDPAQWPIFVPSVHMDEVGLIEQSPDLRFYFSERMDGGWIVTHSLWCVPEHLVDTSGPGFPDHCSLYGTMLDVRLDMRDPYEPFYAVIASESAQLMVSDLRLANPGGYQWPPANVDCTGEDP